MKKVYHNHIDSKNPNYKGGLPKCIDCGRKISRPSKKCRQCASKDRRGKKSWAYKNRGKKHPLYGIRGEKHHAWEGGKASPKKCKDCGKKIKYSSKRCKIHANQKNRNPSWKGGVTPLHLLIRDLEEYNEWHLKIFKRDNFICQQCNSNKNIEVHHIKPFSLILKEFLQKYNQFSPLEDKETLVRLAMTYEPFWDINNGSTLCNDCHNITKKVSKELYKLK